MEKHVTIIERIQNLTSLYKKYNIDSYLVPSTDEYLSEYSPDFAKRLQYITGFAGSNGYGVIHPDKIYFFTDGRYFKQAENQLPQGFNSIYDINHVGRIDSLYSSLGKVGYNPKLFCKTQINIFNSLNLVPIEDDLIDFIWTDSRPNKSEAKAFIYEEIYAGETSQNKIVNLQKDIKKLGGDYYLVTDCTSICWLLNIRASDVPFCPLLLAKLIVSKDKLYLFTDLNKVKDLKFDDSIVLLEESEIYKFLSKISGSIIVDNNKTPMSYLNAIEHLDVIHQNDLCTILKSIKNDIEIEGTKKAHIKDAVSVIEFFSWLNDELKSGSILTEFDLGKKLTYFRSQQDGYLTDSFSAICGFRDNGAIIHYRAEEHSAKKIDQDGLLLVDSGGHYYGGTTDITRAINIGTPKSEHINFYTKVLKGHLALLITHFPYGTACNNLDPLARQYLWQEGCNFAHGTGHGVGNMLSVHEGPQAFNLINNIKLEKNMILSNEPGYYLEGQFGIRIENLVYVADSQYSGFAKFENLTMVPYCFDLIDFSMLNEAEKKYLVEFYNKISASITGLLSDNAKKYLNYHIDSLLKKIGDR